MARIIISLPALLCLIGLLHSTEGANCNEKVADIVFLLDSSTSIRTEQFQEQLHFVQNVADNFKIGSNNIQVGAITFSDETLLNFHLNEHQTTAELKSAISEIPYIGGGTNTAKAIAYAREEMFKPEHGGRAWAAKILVLITDGFLNRNHYVAAQQEAYFAKHTNITIMAIGVGSGVQDMDLEGLASTPREKYVFRVDEYQALNTLRNELSIKTCEGPLQKDQSNEKNLEPEKQPKKFCGGKPADMYFLLDSSNSIHITDFDRQLRFVSDIVDIFDISESHTRVGVTLYSDRTHPVIPINNDFDKDELKFRVRNLHRLTGNTNTAAALKNVREYGFRDDIARSEVAHIVVLLTDGKSTNTFKTEREAELAHKAGIYVFAIGIGDMASIPELMAIASDPAESFMFKVNNYNALRHLRNILAIKACTVEATQNDKSVENNFACGTYGPRDIMFVFDGVSLGLEKSTVLRKAIGKIAKNMGLESKQDQRVGVMSEVYAHGTDSRLAEIRDQESFEERLDNAKEGKLRTLLRKLRHHSFLPINGGRSNAEHVAVLFLDRRSEITPLVIHEAIRTAFKIKLYVVVVGDEGSVPDADRMCSSPPDRYLLHVPTYADVSASTVSIARQICDA
ncbi:cartilage matrix protein-like [Mizuhopecten yessoensis]|uniref:Collagen alpha-4(VI) chain n=1 Tax=Mizuhopecten yessoensis TaxID=6573 RepID=A0A210QI43_MIZYE|nr:cartilage matrix protein-like [Mizuhopecten yessoensis]OWF48412.1 Collagen alpha-4(VI) chain [Mizuhopecten yessoensis]